MKKKTVKYQIREDEIIHKVAEKEIAYYRASSVPAILNDDTHFLIDKTRKGISMHQIQQQMNKYDLTLKEMANVLNVSERTLQRYETHDLLGKDASERALHLQRLYERGTEVFGSLSVFCEWMKTPILLYNHELPISYLDTIFAFELLEQELGRIEHGIFA